MMQKIRKYLSSDDAGLTLLEVIIAMVITGFLAIGLTRITGMSMSAMAYTQATTVQGSNSASLNAIFNNDLTQSNGVIVPSANFVNSNVCMTLSNTLVKPVLTLSTQSNILPTNASWDSTKATATFTYNGPQVALTVGQLVDIAGMTNTLLNSNGLNLLSSTSQSFTVQYPAATAALLGSGNEAETSAAAAVVYKWVGYEIHANAATGTSDLWRVQCAAQGAAPDANAQILRTGFDPNIDWTNAVQCTSSAMVTSTCTKDALLNATNGNAVPAITFTIPATVPSTSPLYQQNSPVYPQEVLLAARSLS